MNTEVNVADVIKAAAESTLGVLSLLVIVLAVLAFRFFAGAREGVRIGIFFVLLIAALAFGASLMKSSNNASTVNSSAETKLPPNGAAETSALDTQIYRSPLNPDHSDSRQQRSALSARIAALSDDQVIKVASAMLNHFRDRPAALQRTLMADYPPDKWLGSPKNARKFLLYWILQESAPDEMNQWAAAIGEAQKGTSDAGH